MSPEWSPQVSQDEAGRPLEGFSLADSQVLYGDGIDMPVTAGVAGVLFEGKSVKDVIEAVKRLRPEVVIMDVRLPDGKHGVITSWGFLALRLPEDDTQWLENRVTILKAIGAVPPDRWRSTS